MTRARDSSQHAGSLLSSLLSRLQSSGWHRLARCGAYLCALAQEVRSRYDSPEQTSSGSAAPVESKATQPGPPRVGDLEWLVHNAHKGKTPSGVIDELPQRSPVRTAKKIFEEGGNVTVGSFKEADQVLHSTLPNAKKITGAGPRSPQATGALQRRFRGTDPNGMYHKDYLRNGDGVIYGHENLPDLHPHKWIPHINVKLPDGTKLTIFIN